MSDHIEKFDNYIDALEDFAQYVDLVKCRNWTLRSAGLDYEVDYDTKIGTWRVYVRWMEIDNKTFMASKGPTLPRSIGSA